MGALLCCFPWHAAPSLLTGPFPPTPRLHFFPVQLSRSCLAGLFFKISITSSSKGEEAFGESQHYLPHQIQTMCSTGGNHSCSFCQQHLVGLSGLGSHHPEHPRVRRPVGARHQLGQLHRAGCSFPLLTKERHKKPKPNSAAATTRAPPGWLHLQPSPTSELVPGSRLPLAMPNSLPRFR